MYKVLSYNIKNVYNLGFKKVSTFKHTSFIAIFISPTSIHYFPKVIRYLALNGLNHQKLKFK